MSELKKMRAQIDQIDQELLRLLQDRYLITDELSKIKEQLSLPTTDPAREEEIFSMIGAMYPTMKESLGAVMTCIIKESKTRQEKMRRK